MVGRGSRVGVRLEVYSSSVWPEMRQELPKVRAVGGLVSGGGIGKFYVWGVKTSPARGGTRTLNIGNDSSNP